MLLLVYVIIYWWWIFKIPAILLSALGIFMMVDHFMNSAKNTYLKVDNFALTTTLKSYSSGEEILLYVAPLIDSEFEHLGWELSEKRDRALRFLEEKEAAKWEDRLHYKEGPLYDLLAAKLIEIADGLGRPYEDYGFTPFRVQKTNSMLYIDTYYVPYRRKGLKLKLNAWQQPAWYEYKGKPVVVHIKWKKLKEEQEALTEDGKPIYRLHND